MLILIVVSGPDKGKVFELAGRDTIILGRDGDPVRLSDSKASRQHATLGFHDGHWHIRDQNSRHGTFHNHERVTGEARLQDGDHIQVGSTLLVLAQADDAAHHAALAATPTSAPTSTGTPPHADAERSEAAGITSTPAPAWRTPALLAAALGGALLLAGGGTLYLNHQIEARAQDLARDLADRDDRLAERDERIERLLAQRPTDPELLQIVAKLDAQEAHFDAIDDLTALVKAQPDTLAPKLEAILAKLDGQPDYTGELASLRDAMESSLKMQQPLTSATTRLAEANQGLISRMETLITRAEKQPSLDEVRETLAALNQRLDDEPGADAIIRGVTDALAARPADPALAEVRDMLAQLTEQGRQAAVVQDQLASLEAAVRDANQRQAQADELATTMLQSLADRLDATGGDEAVLAAITQLKADLPLPAVERIEASIAKLGDAPSPEQIATAVGHELSQDRESQALALAKLTQLLDGEPWADKIREQGEQTREALAAVTTALQDRPTLEQVRTELASLSQGDRDAVREQFDQVLAAVQGGGDVAAELAAVQKLLKQQPAMAEAALSRVMEAVQTLQADDDGQRMLAAIQELQGMMGGMSLVATGEVKHQVQRGVIDAMVAAKLLDEDTLAAMMNARGDEDASQLTEVEILYRYAWVSNEPVTIGLGKVNPLTGQAEPGQLIDPRLAKQAGIQNWRQWYTNDRYIATRNMFADPAAVARTDPSTSTASPSAPSPPRVIEDVNLDTPGSINDPFINAIPDDPDGRLNPDHARTRP